MHDDCTASVLRLNGVAIYLNIYYSHDTIQTMAIQPTLFEKGCVFMHFIFAFVLLHYKSNVADSW